MNPGIILQATPKLDDDFFEKSVIFISEVNVDGATGFVVNKPFGRNLNELVEFSETVPFPLHDGGPVDREGLYIIHRRPDLISGTKLITDGLYMGGEMKDVVDSLNSGELQTNYLKIFVGYCGWNTGELEKEIGEGSWIMVADQDLLFN